jgi:hypothetical protein
VRLCLALSRPNDRYPQVVEDLDKGREEEETENESVWLRVATRPTHLDGAYENDSNQSSANA